jgi:hypothetical protein
MAFNFFGTFTTGQWQAFKAFTQIQRKELVLRQQWLQKQLIMNGIFSTEYDGPNPVSFSASAGSYAAKLLSAYKILGGVPEQDMLLRTRDKPVFKTKGTNIVDQSPGQTEGGYSDVYSNGRRERGSQRFDRDLGLLVERLKDWQLESIKLKREKLEFKIKRAMDYSDQLKQEIDLISVLLGVDISIGSVDDQIISVETQMATPGTMNVVDDLDDIHGLRIGKPGDLSEDNAIGQGVDKNERVPV